MLRRTRDSPARSIGVVPDAAARVPAGILLVDKPEGITSHGVVARVRRVAGTRKVGHAGTLDPMATGVLVIGVESATRLLTFLVGADKEYTATIRLGAATSTDDREGETIATADAADLAAVDDARIDSAVAALTGQIDQVPSAVSAIKVAGERAYARVRAGESVELAARRVTIREFDVLARRRSAEALDLDVRVVCTSGTYIRALARDLGAALRVGGHLTALRRTRVGPLRIADAVGLGDLAEHGASAALVSPASAARRLFPAVELDSVQARDLANGKRLALPDVVDGSPVAAIAPTADWSG